MRKEIKVTKIRETINKWSYNDNNKGEFTWFFSKEMPIKDCKVSMNDLSSILNSQLKKTEKLVAMFMYLNRFANTTACLYTNIRAAEKLGITNKTMGKALNNLVNAGILGRVKKDCGEFVGYQYYIKEVDLWNLPLKEEETSIVKFD